MLWTDADFVTSTDLITLDSEVQAVASAEDITLDDPVSGAGIIHRGIEEAGDRLMKYLQQFGGALNNGQVSANHYAAVMNIGQSSINRAKVLRTQIVVSELSPLQWSTVKRWVAYWCLHCFFRDVANRTVKERYQDKEKRYLREANTIHWDALRALGVPVVTQPLPCPGAVYEPRAGVWGDSCLSAVAGPGALEGAVEVAVTWVDLTAGKYVSPDVPNNAESGPSAKATVTLASGQVAKVDISPLVPPNGAQPLGTLTLAAVPFLTAGGWNVYAAQAGQPLRLQNSVPVPVGTKAYTLAGDPDATGWMVGSGQYAERYMTMPSGMIQRG